MKVIIELEAKDAQCLAYSLECQQEENAKRGIFTNTEVCLGVASGINAVTGRHPSIEYGEISNAATAYVRFNPRVTVRSEEE